MFYNSCLENALNSCINNWPNWRPTQCVRWNQDQLLTTLPSDDKPFSILSFENEAVREWTQCSVILVKFRSCLLAAKFWYLMHAKKKSPIYIVCVLYCMCIVLYFNIFWPKIQHIDQISNTSWHISIPMLCNFKWYGFTIYLCYVLLIKRCWNT